jgi:hypothetical protein
MIIITCQQQLLIHCGIRYALTRTFGPKRAEVKGGWRKLHNVELHNMYSSPNIIKLFKSVGCERW